jgi:biopolymer transport protein ExbD
MKVKKARMHYSKDAGIDLPDLIPFASMLLLLSCMFFLAGRFRSPHIGMVDDSQLPFNNVICWRNGTVSSPIISIDRNNHRSFGIQEFDVDSPTAGTMRTAVIRRVCASHGIKLTAFQVAESGKLAWLSTNIEALPNFLSLSSQQQFELVRLNKVEPISDRQLREYIVAAKMATDAILKRHMSVYLRIDGDVEAGKVIHLIDILQDLGINRFELMAQSR